MKNKLLVQSFLMLSCLVLTGCNQSTPKVDPTPTPEPTPEPTPVNVLTKKELPFYYDLETKSSINAYFVKDDVEIPYIDLSTGINIIQTKINNDLKPINFKINLSSNGSVSTLSREDGSKVVVDFKNSTISFVDYDNFFKYSNEYNTNDIVTMSGRTEGSSMYSYIMRDLTKSYVINGKDFVINLNDYSIPMYYENETGYMPFQTFSDIFLAYFGTTYV